VVAFVALYVLKILNKEWLPAIFPESFVQIALYQAPGVDQVSNAVRLPAVQRDNANAFLARAGAHAMENFVHGSLGFAAIDPSGLRIVPGLR
jgi:hypothetical protein